MGPDKLSLVQNLLDKLWLGLAGVDFDHILSYLRVGLGNSHAHPAMGPDKLSLVQNLLDKLWLGLVGVEFVYFQSYLRVELDDSHAHHSLGPLKLWLSLADCPHYYSWAWVAVNSRIFYILKGWLAQDFQHCLFPVGRKHLLMVYSARFSSLLA